MSLFLSAPSWAVILIVALVIGTLVLVLFRKNLFRRLLLGREKSLALLRQISWLYDLDDREFKAVARKFRIQVFPEGAKLLKEQESDNGLFMIVAGVVRIEIRGELMGNAGTGSVLGEMAFLTGHPRTATVVAASPVQVLWIRPAALRSVMKKLPELRNGLWEFASMRFAMNLLGRKQPYSLWEENKFIQWLSAGEIKLPNENGWIDLEGKIGVLVIGTAAQHDGSTVVKAPCTLTGTDFIFSKEARVFLRDE